MLNGAGACCDTHAHLVTTKTVKTTTNWLSLFNRLGHLLALGYAIQVK
ncbi:hypothetical protein PALB_22430 [Pseudoalteromonas luteoviolacea B = ATCC 29581]|nr:hypothetical protein PALB_22430 [Pseudoalteromonas luteoviolacea B = ATCC 29581]